ncbi:MAG TPA: NAD-dependent deacylase [bacterium]
MTDRDRGDEAGPALAAAATRLRAARFAVALTGAGISVESGIPDFRSPGGLWSVFRPEEYATIEAFRRDPAKAWRLYRALGETLAGREPNDAHRALAALEEAGLLRLVITQNIDGLHQAAGSRAVIEMHGDHRRLQCPRCGHLEDVRPERFAEPVPACPACAAPLKPNVVLFGEPVRDLDLIEAAVARCDLLLVVGTSAQVYPAAGIPAAVRARGGVVIEFNREETPLTAGVVPAGLHFRGPAGHTLARFARAALGD